MSEEKEIIINGIDVSKYFIEVVDEGGSTINYKILPNFERLLVEKIFEQNQKLARLQEENKKLKADLEGETEQCQKWYQLETDKHFQMLKYEQALEEIREILMRKIYGLNENASQPDYMCYVLDKFEKIRIKILTKISEVLNDRN